MFKRVVDRELKPHFSHDYSVITWQKRLHAYEHLVDTLRQLELWVEDGDDDHVRFSLDRNPEGDAWLHVRGYRFVVFFRWWLAPDANGYHALACVVQ